MASQLPTHKCVQVAHQNAHCPEHQVQFKIAQLKRATVFRTLLYICLGQKGDGV